MENVLKRLLESKVELTVTPTYVRGVLMRIEIVNLENELNIDAVYVGGICDVVIELKELSETLQGITIKEFEQILEVEHIK